MVNVGVVYLELIVGEHRRRENGYVGRESRATLAAERDGGLSLQNKTEGDISGSLFSQQIAHACVCVCVSMCVCVCRGC